MRERFRALWVHLKTEHTEPPRMAAAVFLGTFIGVLPIYGVHIVSCIFLAWLLGLNKLTMVLAAHISTPPLAPILVGAGIAIGEWVRFGRPRPLDLKQARSFLDGVSIFAGKVPDLFVSALVGDTLLGLVLATLFAAVAYRVSERWQSGGEAAGEVPEAPGDP